MNVKNQETIDGSLNWLHVRAKPLEFLKFIPSYRLDPFRDNNFVKEWIVHAAGLIVPRISICRDNLASMQYIDPVKVGR